MQPFRYFSKTFIAFNHPNFRKWFIGQLFSLVGTWMQATAQGYLIYELTHSPAYLGYVGFIGGLPTILFTLFGGVVADRMPRRKMIVVTQAAMMILAFILAGLVFSGVVQPWHIMVLAFFLGIANAFDAPARQAFVVELVEDRNDLTNAIALNASMFNLATVFGPAVGGMVYAWVGPAWCFTLNGLSFISVIVALLLMRMAPFVPKIHHMSAMREMGDGLRYVIHDETVRLLIISLGFVSVFGFSMVTLMPAWAVDVLGGDVTTNGLLLSARGLGSLFGALTVATLGSRNMRGKVWSTGILMVPAMLFVFSFIRAIPWSLVCLMVLGWALMAVTNSTNAMVQTHIPDDLRGRVMSVYALVLMGAMPIGSLWTGSMADRIGAPLILQINVALLAAYSIFMFIRRPQVRALA